MNTRTRPDPASPRALASVSVLAGLVLAGGCTADGPGGTWANPRPGEIDVYAEARTHNDGTVYEFVLDERGFVRTPDALPAGDVMVTLTYEGAMPAPHSLVFAGLNGDQPVVAVDLPGSNNGVVVVPAGPQTYFDGAPGNRDRGYTGHLDVSGEHVPPAAARPDATLSWRADGLAFTAAPASPAPAGVPIALELTVGDALPHSVAFEDVRGEQPLVAVDGRARTGARSPCPPARTSTSARCPATARPGWKGS